MAAACRSSLTVAPPRQSHRRGRIGRDAFAAAGEAELLAGGRLHRHAVDVDAGEARDASRAWRRDAGRCVGASQTMVRSRCAMRPPRAFSALDRESEKAVGRGAVPLRIARREMRADVAVGERAEDGVGERMQRDVGVGMAGQRLRVCDADAAERDVIAGREGMHVDAGAGAHIAERARRRALRRARNRPALVILMLPGSPAKTLTFMPAHSASAASSVKSSRPCAAARRWAASRAAKSKACGVCTRRRLLRSSVLSTRPSASTVLTVSVTGRAGMAAPLARPRRSRATIRSALAKGRAASCTRTMSGGARAQGFQPGTHRGLPGGAADRPAASVSIPAAAA